MKDRQLAVFDQPTIFGRVHRIHHLGQCPLHLHTKFGRQLLTIDLNQPFHGYSLSGIPCQKHYSTLCPENWADPLETLEHSTLEPLNPYPDNIPSQ